MIHKTPKCISALHSIKIERVEPNNITLCQSWVPWITKLTHSTLIFLGQNNAPSQQGIGDLSPKTAIIGQLLNQFQDVNPELSITLIMWKVICLSAYLRNADQQELILFMQQDGKNAKFFKTLATCFIHHNLTPNGFHLIPDHSALPVGVTIPHLARTFPNEKMLQDSENKWNINGKNYFRFVSSTFA